MTGGGGAKKPRCAYVSIAHPPLPQFTLLGSRASTPPFPPIKGGVRAGVAPARFGLDLLGYPFICLDLLGLLGFAGICWDLLGFVG